MSRSCASCQTNDFQLGLLEMFYLDGIFDFQMTWKTIQGGMSKLPEFCAADIKKKDGAVLMNAKVKSLMQEANGVRIGYSRPNSDQLEYESFDAVIRTCHATMERTYDVREASLWSRSGVCTALVSF